MHVSGSSNGLWVEEDVADELWRGWGSAEVVSAQALTRRPSAAPTFAATSMPTTELTALELFYNSTNGEYWHWNATVAKNQEPGVPWNFNQSDPNPCTERWQGITCSCTSITCHVHALSLPRHNVVGGFPESLAQLTELTVLDLSGNVLQSTIPPDFYHLSSLQTLDLKENMIAGNLSDDIFYWQSMRVLNLSRNLFTGSIPLSLYNLTNLRNLQLGENTFNGTISSRIGNLQWLTALSVFNNSFSSRIPIEIGSLTRLTEIQLRFNAFTSTVPKELFQLPLLQHFDIGHNQLTGPLPDLSTATCFLLHIFHVNSNAFTRKIPERLYDFTGLLSLYLYENLFTGSLSPNVSRLTNLIEFPLRQNMFTGKIPESMRNMTKLNVIGFTYNFFTGSSEPLYVNKPLLTAFEISDNYFSGDTPVLGIPKSLGPSGDKVESMPLLTTYAIAYNLYNGKLPENTVTQRGMLFFDIEGNFFSGSVPAWLQYFKVLSYVNLGYNLFSGNLNSSFLAITPNLAELTLSQNMITGPVPCVLWSDLKDLTLIDIGSNLMTGTIPEQFFGNFSRLKTIILSQNAFVGDMRSLMGTNDHESLANVDMSDNLFTGTIPSDFFMSMSLQSVVLSSNCLSGTIPVTICACPELMNLVLDGLSSKCRKAIFPGMPYFTSFSISKSIRGSLPSCIYSSHRLQSLHVSGNALEGQFPDNFTLSRSLVELSMSHNNLKGSIPHVIQDRSWNQLDLSFNKLDGTLSASIGMPSIYDNNGSSSITLKVNRLSGTVPAVLINAESISILDGNLFDCQLFDRSSLPQHDPDLSNYSCGSDAIVSAIVGWIALLCLSLCCLLVVIIRRRRHRLRKERQDSLPQGKAAEDEAPRGWGCEWRALVDTLQQDIRNARRHFFEVDIQVKRHHSTHQTERRRQQKPLQSKTVHLSESVHDQESPLTSSHHDQNNTDNQSNSSNSTPMPSRYPFAMFVFDRLLTFVRQIFASITLLICLVLLPLYYWLTSIESMYSFTYAWQISSILHSGERSGAVLTTAFLIVVLALVALFTRKLLALHLFSRRVLREHEWTASQRPTTVSVAAAAAAAAAVEAGSSKNVGLLKCASDGPSQKSESSLDNDAVAVANNEREAERQQAWHEILRESVASLVDVYADQSHRSESESYPSAVNGTLASESITPVSDFQRSSSVSSQRLTAQTGWLRWTSTTSFTSRRSPSRQQSSSLSQSTVTTQSRQRPASYATRLSLVPTESTKKMLAQRLLMVSIGLLNFAVMILIDIVYVNVVLTGRSTTVLVVQLLLSIFKLVWNEGVVWQLFPLLRRLLLKAMTDSTGSDDNVSMPLPAQSIYSEESTLTLSNSRHSDNLHEHPQSTVSMSTVTTSPTETSAIDREMTHRHTESHDELLEHQFTSAEVTYLVFTVILNNIVIPCVSVAIVSSDCFYNAFFARPPSEETTIVLCNYYVALGVFKKCLSSTELTEVATFYTPFFYRYQCSAAFVMNFASVHVFMFAIVGFVLPLLRVLWKRAFHRALMAVESSENIAPTPWMNWTTSVRRLWLQTLLVVTPCVLQTPQSVVNQILDKQHARALSDVNAFWRQQGRSVTWMTRFVNKEKLVVRLCAYLSIVLTFGVLFPPLAVIGCVAVYISTFLEEYSIGSFLSAAKERWVTAYSPGGGEESREQRGVYYQLLRELVCRDCHGIVALWYDVLWLLAPFASFLYAWVVFDTLGDRYGWKIAVIPALIVFAFPFGCLAVVRCLESMGKLSASFPHWEHFPSSVDDTNRDVSPNTAATITATTEVEDDTTASATSHSDPSQVAEDPIVVSPFHRWSSRVRSVDNVGSHMERMSSVEMVSAKRL